MIDCKSIAEEIKKECAEKIVEYKVKDCYLKIIQVEGDIASDAYTKGKVNDCKEVKLGCEHILLPADCSYLDVVNEINKGNKDYRCIGIILQLPLPQHLKKYEASLLNCILNEKDVDGFKKDSLFSPCTPSGIIEILLKTVDGSIDGLHCVIVGRGQLVGKPLFKMLNDLNATVTLCNSHTPKETLKKLCLSSDIVITAVGKPNLITKDMVNPNTIVIDAGINRDEDGKLCGDCDKALYEYVENITAVPNGVGLLTRAMLLKNCTKYMEVDE